MKSKNDEEGEEKEQKAADKTREKVKSIYNKTSADFETLAEYDNFLEEREDIIRLLLQETPMEVTPSKNEMSVAFSGDTCEVAWVAPNSDLSFFGIRKDWFTVEKIRSRDSANTESSWQDPTPETVAIDLSTLCLLLRVNKEAIWDSIDQYKKDHGRQIQQRTARGLREKKQAVAHIIKTEGTFFARVTKNSDENTTDGQPLRHAFERKYEDLMELEHDDAMSAADSQPEVAEMMANDGHKSKNRKSTNDQMSASGWPMHAWRRKAEDMLAHLWGY